MSAEQVEFLRCQVNRILVLMDQPEVTGGDFIDGKLVLAAVSAADFADKYPQIQPAKKFDVYKAITDFIAAPSTATLEKARPALIAILHVVGEYEGVENECGDFDVNIQGVWPPPPPPGGTDVLKPLSPIPIIPGAGTPGFTLPDPSVASSKFTWLLVGGAVIGAIGGVIYAKRKFGGRRAGALLAGSVQEAVGKIEPDFGFRKR